MSFSNQKSVTQKGNKVQGPGASKKAKGSSDRPRGKIVKVNAKWIHGEQPLPSDTVQSSHLKDQITIVVQGPGSKRTELVVHHPIGITDLSADDWVVTTIYGVAELLGRTKNPNLQNLNRKRSEALRTKLFQSGVALKLENGDLSYPGQEDSRQQILKDLKAGRYAPEKEMRVEAMEAKFIKAQLPYLLEVQKEHPDEFRTASGPLWDRKQVAVSEYKGMPADSIAFEISKRIASGGSVV